MRHTVFYFQILVFILMIKIIPTLKSVVFASNIRPLHRSFRSANNDGSEKYNGGYGVGLRVEPRLSPLDYVEGNTAAIIQAEGRRSSTCVKIPRSPTTDEIFYQYYNINVGNGRISVSANPADSLELLTGSIVRGIKSGGIQMKPFAQSLLMQVVLENLPWEDYYAQSMQNLSLKEALLEDKHFFYEGTQRAVTLLENVCDPSSIKLPEEFLAEWQSIERKFSGATEKSEIVKTLKQSVELALKKTKKSNV